ncbi:MAG: hypothetical protein SFU56_08885 [Capsulimonadales bacterium]|nr:hypothetical protein [Capsulimonadales bacterium]
MQQPMVPVMKRLTASLLSGILAVILTIGGAAAQTEGKKLIELGWDIPDTGFMRANIAEMEKSPFDGTIFFAFAPRDSGGRINLSRSAWSKTPFSPEMARPAIEDLKATKFRKFTDNFLRVDLMPADIDWFDDYSPVVGNLRLMARIAREGGVKGIFLDTEQYANKGYIFTYDKQRNRSTKSLEQYGEQARQRGREILEAIQEEYPDLTLILSFGRSLAITERGKPRKSSGIRYDLLPAFVDGLTDAARGKTSIVDGFEPSYKYREKSQFADAYRIIKEEAAREAPDADRYRKYVTAGFGIWLDADWQKTGWSMTSAAGNYFPPDDLRDAVRAALNRSDRYVWVYSQKPNWWKRTNVPKEYLRALREARKDASGNP